MYIICITIVITAIATIHETSLIEWMLHKYVMHRPILGFRYPFEAHAQLHHQSFKSDETYHLINEKVQDKWTIPMAWWNGPVLIFIASRPSLLVWIVLPNWEIRLWMYATNVVFIALYYGAYEYIHWCMHLPKERLMEKWSVFIWLDQHHRLHHERMGRNFNVVYPFADWVMGTLLRTKH